MSVGVKLKGEFGTNRVEFVRCAAFAFLTRNTFGDSGVLAVLSDRLRRGIHLCQVDGLSNGYLDYCCCCCCCPPAINIKTPINKSIV